MITAPVNLSPVDTLRSAVSKVGPFFLKVGSLAGRRPPAIHHAGRVRIATRFRNSNEKRCVMKTTSAAVRVPVLCSLLFSGVPGNAQGATGAKIGLNFTGADQRQANVIIPDTNGAVGPDHIVELLNNIYSVYDKATGQLLQRMDPDAFWK
jgi:hypothetical protein